MAAVLATRDIPSHAGRFRADVEGDIRDAGGVLKITDIRVRYHLLVEPGREDAARWCFANYLTRCPAAQSVAACIRIEHSLKTETAPSPP